MTDNNKNNMIINCYLDLSTDVSSRSIQFMEIKENITNDFLFYVPFALNLRSLSSINNFKTAVYESHTILPNSIDELFKKVIDGININLLIPENFKQKLSLSSKLNITLNNNNDKNNNYYLQLYFLMNFLRNNIGYVENIESKSISIKPFDLSKY